MPCAPVSLNVTTDLYQNNVYDVELFWAHRQQVIIDCCDVLKHDVFLHTAVLAPMSRAYLVPMLAITMCQWLVGTD